MPLVFASHSDHSFPPPYRYLAVQGQQCCRETAPPAFAWDDVFGVVVGTLFLVLVAVFGAVVALPVPVSVVAVVVPVPVAVAVVDDDFYDDVVAVAVAVAVVDDNFDDDVDDDFDDDVDVDVAVDSRYDDSFPFRHRDRRAQRHR